MGNNSSSAHRRSEEMGRGWTHSFPRELTRHHSQPAGRKVLPEPPNQRLRATNNGTIILNGGTISGRRSSTLTLPHDLNKQGVFRSRSTSGSNLGEHSARRFERYYRYYQPDSTYCVENEARELKRFGSEPELRYSPSEHRRPSPFHSERETRERESKYKCKKKYKAPAPPGNYTMAGSSPDVSRKLYKLEDDVRLPPRRSRLFKTHAETKKTQISWQSGVYPRRSEEEEHVDSKENKWTVTRGHEPQDDRWRRDDAHHSKVSSLDGKNTLRRSMSSPEFQAELIRVAKKVRDKLDCSRSLIDPSVELFESSSSLNPRCSDTLDKDVYEPHANTEEGQQSSTKGQEEQEPSEERQKVKSNRVDSHGRENKPQGENWRYSRKEQQGDELSQRKSERVEDVAVIDPRDSLTNGQLARGRLEASGHYYGVQFPCEKRKERHVDNSTGLHDRWSCENIRRESISSANATTTVRPELHETVVDGRAVENQNSSQRCKEMRSNYLKPIENKWTEKLDSKSTGNGAQKGREGNWHVLSCTEKSAPRTFYFGMNEKSSTNFRNFILQRLDDAQSKHVISRDTNQSAENPSVDADDGKIITEDISLKLRPTLPKKQLEIPRFSPSAAWRLLSALQTPGPTMSTASEEMPIMYEERIERLSRLLPPPPPPPPPSPPLVPLGPRSLQDKSGDSGISGDAGAVNEDTLDANTMNKIRLATRHAWTPQQDLEEESSSDAGVDSPPPPVMSTSLNFINTRAHVFSLSLPRDDNRTYLYSSEFKGKETSTFNSLQKLKRSVTGVLGFGQDLERKRPRGILDDNWLLSSSAPTSLQHHGISEVTPTSLPTWRPFFDNEADGHERNLDRVRRHENVGSDDDGDDVIVNDSDDENGEEEEEEDEEDEEDEQVKEKEEEEEAEEEEEEEEEKENYHRHYAPKRKRNKGNLKNNHDFPAIMKAPSFQYLTSGGHVIYLPETDNRKDTNTAHERRTACKKTTGIGEENSLSKHHLPQPRNIEKVDGRLKDSKTKLVGGKHRGERSNAREIKKNRSSILSKSGESISEIEQRCDSIGENRRGANISSGGKETTVETKNVKAQPKGSSRGRRFTFQSTVRQIERRRLAEKLSKEAEAKERQRKSELEAMRKVEEEFQRKRAREKANIRQQLRLYNMEESLNSSGAWDSSHSPRADPDGAPSSATSSPTLVFPTKLSGSRNNSVNSDQIDWKGRTIPGFRHRQQEQLNYRPKYYDWPPDSASHLEYKHTTVHPQIFYDIPKSSSVVLDTNTYGVKQTNSSPTLRSDNYRKDFAHGTVTGRSPLMSSDSELSQSNTRPHSRQTGTTGKPTRSRSASPERSEDEESSEEGCPFESTKQPRDRVRDFLLNGLQPFVREKTYRPISFNPQPPPPIPI